jgi:hypothetical protein
MMTELPHTEKYGNNELDTVGMFEKFIKLFIAMYPLHVNVIYKPEQ